MNHEYTDEIMTHLEEKYNTKFKCNKIIRRIEVSDADVVLAQCSSENYPNEFFDVLYHLSSEDIYKKDDILTELRENGYNIDESMLFEGKNKSTPYFEDNYINIIKQHEFDDSGSIPQGVKIITKINTFNYYPSSEDNQLSLEEYFQNMKDKIMLENYIFAPNGIDFAEDKCITTIVNSLVSKQFICVIHTNNTIEECVKAYYKNYEFPYEAFQKNDNTVSINKYVFYYGCKA